MTPERVVRNRGGGTDSPEIALVDGERLSLGVAARSGRVPAGAHPGQEDGQGHDLVAGARGLHAHQLDPDPSRPVELREVRKRGVGYRVDSLVSEIRKILRTSGQHNIALFGAGKLGQAIASSDIFADHGFRVAAVFDVNPKLVGRGVGDNLVVQDFSELDEVVTEEEIVVGVLAVPAKAAQEVADRLVDNGVKIIFNYSEQLLDVPPR